MSIQALCWVIKRSKARLGDRLVLFAIANHADADGEQAWPSVQTLSQEALLSERQVQRALQSLEERGEIKVDRGAGPKGVHAFSIPGIRGDNLSGDNLSGRQIRPLGVTNPTTRGDISDKEGRQIGQESVSDLSPKPSLENRPKNRPKNRPESISCGLSDSDAFKLEPDLLPPTARPANGHHHNGARMEVDLDAAVDAAELMTSLWNEECAGVGLLGRAMKPSRARQANCLKRWREDFNSDPEAWRAYCRRIAAAPHLRGENDRGWRADLDWVLQPSHLAHIMEGRYDRPAGNGNGADVYASGPRGRADAIFDAAVAAGARVRAHNDRHRS